MRLSIGEVVRGRLRAADRAQNTGAPSSSASKAEVVCGFLGCDAHPAHDWTLEELARAACTSRSVLAERFKHFVGESPMQYLAQWRMQLAAGLLAGGNASIAAIALEVGYGSEAAFSRAFKKLVGASPAAWRAQRDSEARPLPAPPSPKRPR